MTSAKGDQNGKMAEALRCGGYVQPHITCHTAGDSNLTIGN